MNRIAMTVLVLATATLAGCGNPNPRGDLAYLDHSTGTYVVDHSPYNGDYWDRYHYGPRY